MTSVNRSLHTFGKNSLVWVLLWFPISFFSKDRVFLVPFFTTYHLISLFFWLFAVIWTHPVSYSLVDLPGFHCSLEHNITILHNVWMAINRQYLPSWVHAVPYSKCWHLVVLEGKSPTEGHFYKPWFVCMIITAVYVIHECVCVCLQTSSVPG